MPLLPLIHFLFLSLFPAITTASSAGVITAPVFEKLDDLCSPYVPTPAQKYQSQQCLSLLPGAVLSFCETRRIREDECDDLFDSRGASSPVPWDDSAGPIHDPISIMPIEHFNRDPVTNALFNNATALRLYWRVNTSRNTTQTLLMRLRRSDAGQKLCFSLSLKFKSSSVTAGVVAVPFQCSWKALLTPEARDLPMQLSFIRGLKGGQDLYFNVPPLQNVVSRNLSSYALFMYQTKTPQGGESKVLQNDFQFHILEPPLQLNATRIRVIMQKVSEEQFPPVPVAMPSPTSLLLQLSRNSSIEVPNFLPFSLSLNPDSEGLYIVQAWIQDDRCPEDKCRVTSSLTIMVHKDTEHSLVLVLVILTLVIVIFFISCAMYRIRKSFTAPLKKLRVYILTDWSWEQHRRAVETLSHYLKKNYLLDVTSIDDLPVKEDPLLWQEHVVQNSDFVLVIPASTDVQSSTPVDGPRLFCHGSSAANNPAYAKKFFLCRLPHTEDVPAPREMSLAKTYRLPKDLRSLMAKIDAIQISESTLEFEMISESSKSAQRSLSVPTTTTPVSLQTEQLVTTRTPRDGGFSEESPSSSEQELLPSQELISRKFPPSAREVVAQSELLENLLDSAFV